ncbi:MAG: peptide-methionine (S)-S-oxide reductase MsrA [Acidimicrobiales bacterium]|jgi:peptide-methionine (S)-S-oxide reductase
MSFFKNKSEMVSPEQAIRGRDEEMKLPERHLVLGTPLRPPVSGGFERAIFAMGCFWGAERKFWLADGVYTTAVGYSGGLTPNPTYEEVCSGKTGHAEAVLVVFDGTKTSYDKLLSIFWESHDPTQGMRQGNDTGTQYRSAIYTTTAAQQVIAQQSLAEYQRALEAVGYGRITTEIKPAGPFYYAEGYHQQYLQRNPNGYCGLGGTGVSCNVGLTSGES